MTMDHPPRSPRAWAQPGNRPLVVLGRSQQGWPVHRVLAVRQRASGGGAVLSGPWMLRSAVRLPRDHPLLKRGPAAAARWFGDLHLEWLQAQGVRGLERYEGPLQDHWSCFSGRGPGEVLVDGRKLVGIAQRWRRRDALLSAGTLLTVPPWESLCAALGRAPAVADELARDTVAIAECLGHAPDPMHWAGSLRHALHAALAQLPPPSAAPLAEGEPS
jgi:lipoate-protein ligase A